VRSSAVVIPVQIALSTPYHILVEFLRVWIVYLFYFTSWEWSLSRKSAIGM
jgi:hypothetical protein